MPSSSELSGHAADEAVVALRRGVHVVTATKCHLLSHWRALEAAALEGGSLIRISGATGAALPAGDLARTGLRGMGCASIRGCPNGTVTYVLDRLSARDSLQDAVEEAQRRGIAEADPSSDLSGEDAATKVRLLAALLWGWDPADVRVETAPVEEGTAELAVRAALAGRRLRAVASAHADRPLLVRVRLEETEPGDPLHGLAGPEKAVVFECPGAGDVVVAGGRSSPLGAALAMLKDTIDVTAIRRGFY
jgi:homoserine dehydrogenase